MSDTLILALAKIDVKSMIAMLTLSLSYCVSKRFLNDT